LGIIPEDPNVRRCAAFGEPIVLKYPDSPASQAIMQIAAKLTGTKYAPKKTEGKSFIKKFISGLFGGRK
jgi:septum site-determining protein MinD